jgi:formamidopyrimidine-DNA glycosylase
LQLDNHQELRFRDQRKFGRVWLFSTGEIPSFLAKLGPEPLEDEFTVSSLKEHLGERQLAIKKALLNQELIAGLGNIYTDEALFIAGIHPARPVKSLSDSDWIKLHQAIRRVLQEGIDHRGTTKRDYRDAEGHPGSYQNQLKVYGRKGEPCVRCQTPIVKMNFGGRGTHFCPMCQE